MQKLIAGILIFCSIATALLAQEEIDAKFVALMDWALELNQKVAIWNERCSQDKNVEGCQATRDMLNEQFIYFIVCANRYTASEGDDCRAILRPKIIKNQVRMFIWNHDCAGRDLEGKEAAFCKKENEAIKFEMKQLQKEIDLCAHDQKL
jgi:hypothetical protein